MTKAELLAAIAAAPDDAAVYINPGDDFLRSQVSVYIEENEIVLTYTELDPEDDEDE